MNSHLGMQPAVQVHQAMQIVTCAIRHEVDVYVAIAQGRKMTTALGFNAIDRTRIEIAILELARNLLVHAGGGELSFESLSQDLRQGIAVVSQDSGPGIPDIDLAMRDGYSTAQTLGAGLPGVKRLMDSFVIETTVGVGTYMRAIKWIPQERRLRGRLA